jgi:hypothetical protein
MAKAGVNRRQGLVISVATAGFIAAAAYVLREPDGGQQQGERPEAAQGATSDINENGAALREKLLHASAQQLGVTPVRGVWGVLMERGYAKGVATFVALADGTASMYLSSGAGAVRGKAYAPARTAAMNLCAQAADVLAETIPAHEFPAPAKGRVRFYVLGAEGVRMVESDYPAHSDGGRDSLDPLLAAGDGLVDGLKDATSKGVVR